MREYNETAGDETSSATSVRAGERRIGRDASATERVLTDGGFDAGFFEHVVDEVGVGVGVYDDTGQFTYVNDAYAEMLGQSVAELTGQSIWSVNPLVEKSQFEGYWASFDRNETRQVETVHERADGVKIPVETHTTAIEANGERYHVGTIADISERVEGWEKLERQDERLETFASVMSHDLRNPLNVAMGRLRLVDEECDSEHIEPVENSLQRMEDLIDNVLTLAQKGSRLTESEPVSLRETAMSAWATTGEGSASFVVEDGLGVVQSDDSRLCEIFENLIRNALEHGGPEVTIRVGQLESGDGFFIEDDGEGIDPDDHDTVFEYGYSTDPRGTGFGLAIVEEIADAHDWTVELTTSDADGARFEFTGVEIE